MREIKFRVWNEATKCWDKSRLNFLRLCDGAYFFGNADMTGFPVVLMQYTGLKDKNGKEIYEGDIISSESHEPREYEVRFVEAGFCASREDLFIPIDINHFFPSNGPQLEVIGNIYENPELIKTT